MATKRNKLTGKWAIPGYLLALWKPLEMSVDYVSRFDTIRAHFHDVTSFFATNAGYWWTFVVGVLWLTVVALWPGGDAKRVTAVTSEAAPTAAPKVTPEVTPMPLPTSSALIRLPPTARQLSGEERTFTPRTAFEFLDISQSDQINTKKVALLEPHYGKWLRVDEVINDVYLEETPKVVIALDRHGKHGFLHVSFDPSIRDTIAILDRGDRIEAQGRLTKVSGVWIYLEDSELLAYSAQSR
jgi:hypothetical protein